MLKKIWQSKFLILAGLLNKIFKRDPVEVIYNKRLRICKQCPLRDVLGNKCLVPGTGPCCGQCGCSESVKLRSLDSECPHPDGAKWKSEKL